MKKKIASTPITEGQERSAQVTQRWLDKDSSFRPEDEVYFDPARHEVAELFDNTTAKKFVQQHHYSGSYCAASRRFAILRDGLLAGVAVFGPGTNPKTVTNVFGGQAADSLELGRFVLLDELEKNAETWFLARCFEVLRKEGYNGVVSFSDDQPRKRADGSVVFPGHTGGIYQAHNGIYLGRGARNTLRLLPDGTSFDRRSMSKVRADERSSREPYERLVSWGAPQLEAGQDRAAWLRLALATVTRPQAHPGNHKYAWSFARSKRARRALRELGQRPPKRSAQ